MLKSILFFEYTDPIIFSVSFSADPSLLMSSTLNRYVYPVCRILAATDHPLSKLLSSARGPVLSRPRSSDASTSMHGLSRRN